MSSAYQWTIVVLTSVIVLSVGSITGQTQNSPRSEVAGIPVNYDEARVGTYTLPDPLVLADGKRVRDAKTWLQRRRPEIVRLFEENPFGRCPGRPAGMSFEVFDKGTPALDGKAIRRQVTVYFSGDKSGPKMSRYPYQFCANYQKYGDHVDQFPVDAHMLLALIAPRPVLLQTGDKDYWSDPKGEFLAAVAAGPVYQLLGKHGLETDQMPPAGQAILRTIGYLMHAGGHGTLPPDWDAFRKFMQIHLQTNGSLHEGANRAD